MTHTELQNKAYIIASSNSLCETLSYDEIQEISDEDLLSIAWEPFEHWSANALHDHIAQIADNIIEAFKENVT